MKKLALLFFVMVLLTAWNAALADVGGICSGGYDNFNHGYGLTGIGANDIVAVAQNQVGLTNSKLAYWDAWCAAFVNDCAYLAGQAPAIPFISGSTHAVGGLVNAVLNAGGYWVDSPQAGDLVTYFCTTDGYYCHVGIMENSSSSIQGNVANACKRLASPWYYRDGYYNADYPNTTGTCYTVQFLRPNYTIRQSVDLGDSFLAKIHLVEGGMAVGAVDWGNIELDADSDIASQDWRFDKMSDGSYIITNLRDGRVMDLANGGTVNGTNISLCPRHADDNPSLIYQKWYIFENNGYYRLSPMTAPMRSLDAAGGYTTDGINIQLYDNNDTAAQRVRIDKFDGSPLDGISCSKENLTLKVGYSEQLSVSYQTSWVAPLKMRGVAWTSSDASVATVDANGRVTAHGEGTCTITVTSTYNDLLSSTCTVTVESGLEVPEITDIKVNGLNVHLSWTKSPKVDENDVRAYEVFVYSKEDTEDSVWSNTDVTGTSCDITLSEPGEYIAYVRAVNKTENTYSGYSVKEFVALDDEWFYCDELPEDLEDVEIQYLNQYNDREQEESPGEGWTIGETKTSYVNGNILYWEDPEPLQATDTRVYLGTFYYHYCDGYSAVEHYWTERFCNATKLDNNGQFDIVWQGTDDADPRFTVYRLRWNAGEWAGGLATCAHGSSDAMALYYLGHRYQERTAVTTYVWTKEATWCDKLDPNADSVSYRIRKVTYDNQLIIPEDTARIEAEAFENNTLIQEVIVPAGCEYIGSRAFAGCTGLRRAYIPIDTVVEADTFEGCAEVQIIRTGE